MEGVYGEGMGKGGRGGSEAGLERLRAGVQAAGKGLGG